MPRVAIFPGDGGTASPDLTPLMQSKSNALGDLVHMEDVLHRSRPSQWLSLDAWVLAILAGWAIAQLWPMAADLLWQLLRWRLPGVWYGWAILAPLLAGVWRSLVIFTTVYKVTDQRVLRRTGVFSVHWDEIELSRILDYVVTQPFHLRVLGLGNLTIVSSDKSTPRLKLLAQPRVAALRNGIRELVLERQKALGHREIYSSHS